VVTAMITKNAIKVNKIDFLEVKQLVENGKSVVINRNRPEEMKLLRNYKEVAEPWYFTHA